MLFIFVLTGKVIVTSITIQDAHSEQRLNASYFKIYNYLCAVFWQVISGKSHCCKREIKASHRP
jgi:hypothetical protein